MHHFLNRNVREYVRSCVSSCARSCALALALAGPTWLAQAEPVPAAERTPVDIRRTTFVVRDIDKSLALYRDALGLKVIYDQLIGGGKNPDGSSRPPSVRLVLLRANDTFIGALGLMQRLADPAKPAPAPVPAPEFKRAGVGQMIMVINVADLDTRWALIAATPHIKIDTPPERVEYPAPGGGVIPVMFSAVWDPDGNFIELNKLLGSPAGVAAGVAPGVAPSSSATPPAK